MFQQILSSVALVLTGLCSGVLAGLLLAEMCRPRHDALARVIKGGVVVALTGVMGVVCAALFNDHFAQVALRWGSRVVVQFVGEGMGRLELPAAIMLVLLAPCLAGLVAGLVGSASRRGMSKDRARR